jgi:hypothetical protein
VSGSGDISGGYVAMKALLSTFDSEGVPAVYDAGDRLVMDDDGWSSACDAQEGADSFVEARSGSSWRRSFNLNDGSRQSMPLFSEYGKPLGEPERRRRAPAGRSVGVAERAYGVCATA